MDYFDYMEKYGYPDLDRMTYGKPLPDYYDTMYKDGYTPEQILEAVHRTMMKRIRAQQREQEAISNIKITSEVRLKK